MSRVAVEPLVKERNTHADTQGEGDHYGQVHGGANNTSGQGGHAHHERYQVFTFNFDGVESAYDVSLWIFIASIAKIGMYQVVVKQRIGVRVLVVCKIWAVGTHIKVGEFSLTVVGDGEGLKTLRHPKIVC